MKNDDGANENSERPASLSEIELIERVARRPLPGLTLSKLRNFSPEDWKDLEERVGTDAVRALASLLELSRRMEEEND